MWPQPVNTRCCPRPASQTVKRQLRSALAYPSALANGRINHLQRQLAAARKVLAAGDQKVSYRVHILGFQRQGSTCLDKVFQPLKWIRVRHAQRLVTCPHARLAS